MFSLGAEPRCLFELPGVSRFSSRQYSVQPLYPSTFPHVFAPSPTLWHWRGRRQPPLSPSPCVKLLIALRVRLCHYDTTDTHQQGRRDGVGHIQFLIISCFSMLHMYMWVCVFTESWVLPQHVLRDVTAQCAVPFIISSLTFRARL